MFCQLLASPNPVRAPSAHPSAWPFYLLEPNNLSSHGLRDCAVHVSCLSGGCFLPRMILLEGFEGVAEEATRWKQRRSNLSIISVHNLGRRLCAIHNMFANGNACADLLSQTGSHAQFCPAGGRQRVGCWQISARHGGARPGKRHHKWSCTSTERQHATMQTCTNSQPKAKPGLGPLLQEVCCRRFERPRVSVRRVRIPTA